LLLLKEKILFVRLAEMPNALLIVAPRHVADGGPLADRARQAFGKVAKRSEKEALAADTQVYVADTIGEMGLWYRIAPVSFVGHSLDPGGLDLEGKNPFEAAALGSAILHGPSVSYFAESYAALAAAGASREVGSAADLAKAIVALQDDGAQRAMTEGAQRVIAAQSAVLQDTWDVIADHLAAPA
jgi:3-deoxy-D-manno-octulosonic-acid transferase